MTDIDQTAEDAPPRAARRTFLSGKVLALAALLVIVTAGGAGYLFFGDRIWSHPEEGAKQEAAALPLYLEVKPFVVSMTNDSGSPHFVQVGVNFTLPGASAGALITAMLPEVTDAMRQTVLNYKVDDIMNPAGVDKMRQTMLARVNEVVTQRLGAERVKNATGGQANVVQQIYFTTLIVE